MRTSRTSVVALATLLALPLAACEGSGAKTTASASPNPSSSAAAATPPTGVYSVESKVTSTCTPKPEAEKIAETRVVFHETAGKTMFNVRIGRSRWSGPFERAVQPRKPRIIAGCTGTQARSITADGVRADGFDVTVVDTWEGVEACDHAANPLQDQTPTASCRTETKLSFTQVRSLCPARCEFNWATDREFRPDDCKCN
jgi:hypothetical protein